mgnify:FL=1
MAFHTINGISLNVAWISTPLMECLEPIKGPCLNVAPLVWISLNVPWISTPLMECLEPIKGPCLNIAWLFTPSVWIVWPISSQLLPTDNTL